MKQGLYNGILVTMDPQRRVLDPGYVIIDEAGRIEAIGEGQCPSGAIEWIDAKGGIIMPGFVNCHTHIPMSLFRGLGEDMPDRLRRYLFPLEDELLDAKMVEVGTKLSLLELIQGGVTTVCDMYYFEDTVARAVKAAGLRAILGETILSKAAPDARTPYGGVEKAIEFIREWKGDPLITPAFAPHAPYSCDDEQLLHIKKLAESMDVPILMHLAEMPFEVEEIRSKHGESPVQHMDTIGFLSDRLIAAHLIFIDDADISILKSNQVGAAHNVVANAKSGRPVSPAPRMHQAGVAVGLGTDGPMSGNHQDILSLLGYYTKIHKQTAGDNRVCPAMEAVELGTIGGARALKLDHLIGSLEIGKQADLILIDTAAPNILPIHDPYSAIVYAAHPHNVTMTMVSGKFLMKDRVVLSLDQSIIMDRVHHQVKRIAGFAKQLDARVR